MIKILHVLSKPTRLHFMYCQNPEDCKFMVQSQLSLLIYFGFFLRYISSETLKLAVGLHRSSYFPFLLINTSIATVNTSDAQYISLIHHFPLLCIRGLTYLLAEDDWLKLITQDAPDRLSIQSMDIFTIPGIWPDICTIHLDTQIFKNFSPVCLKIGNSFCI